MEELCLKFTGTYEAMNGEVLQRPATSEEIQQKELYLNIPRHMWLKSFDYIMLGIYTMVIGIVKGSVQA